MLSNVALTCKGQSECVGLGVVLRVGEVPPLAVTLLFVLCGGASGLPQLPQGSISILDT